MPTLYLGIILFGGVHVLSLLWPQRAAELRKRLGESRYKGLYSVISLIGLVLMGMGYWHSRSGPASLEMAYVPFDGARHLTLTLVWIGFVLIASNQGRGYISKWLRNPFSIGVALWSIGHLLANGKTSVVLIYGCFLVVALLDIAMNLVRGQRTDFKPQLKRDVIAVVAGTVAYLLALLVFHPYVLNIRVV
jgi:uncharacterized membrane protein